MFLIQSVYKRSTTLRGVTAVRGFPGTEKPLEISVKPLKNSAKTEKPLKNGRNRKP